MKTNRFVFGFAGLILVYVAYTMLPSWNSLMTMGNQFFHQNAPVTMFPDMIALGLGFFGFWTLALAIINQLSIKFFCVGFGAFPIFIGINNLYGIDLTTAVLTTNNWYALGMVALGSLIIIGGIVLG